MLHVANINASKLKITNTKQLFHFSQRTINLTNLLLQEICMVANKGIQNGGGYIVQNTPAHSTEQTLLQQI